MPGEADSEVSDKIFKDILRKKEKIKQTKWRWRFSPERMYRVFVKM